jgi:hypothetical protein
MFAPSSGIWILGPDFSDVINARQRNLGAFSSRGFWMRPGDQFAIWVEDILAATTMNFTCHVYATLLPF